ncbi:hypothetical protein CU097_010882 [Rhizopus azygosporus]|uniref:Uncharacterized protein n=3 Tax=Rhizopus TaxID=4842 RepID=A0A2G4SI04_RHIZD|nr:uncharacterized protein RHIMIDRAFT_295185 [Rhizopus microsporus ATCC 52813]ORE01895.1 hypothetical protein BCV72DRAFT_245601 [Rhizopus microsporus var. microsporus]RCH87591.1 hypothetical protein CU097_010882 [Rhizopus azygosporus]CEG67945.1 hypothetical protein RMATCC62417_04288 [Rhizopus microsporus]PHZ08408.1 hypothetical protein RHIMIDRAFT_295185 [Rhizopus microsporus ATCC 52813]CEI89528.1 hypothetical protein RMCBS344292_03883 [Rhizopus microsporus]
MTQQEKRKESTRSWAQLEIDNAYLKQQNELLNKELSFARYTINALKGITLQKENTLNETRQELERALQHIQLLSYSLKQYQNRNSLLVNPTLIQDNDLSDDLSEEDDILDQQKRSLNIMSKLPLRHKQQQQVFVNNDMMTNF